MGNFCKCAKTSLRKHMWGEQPRFSFQLPGKTMDALLLLYIITDSNNTQGFRERYLSQRTWTLKVLDTTLKHPHQGSHQ